MEVLQEVDGLSSSSRPCRSQARRRPARGGRRNSCRAPGRRPATGSGLTVCTYASTTGRWLEKRRRRGRARWRSPPRARRSCSKASGSAALRPSATGARRQHVKETDGSRVASRMSQNPPWRSRKPEDHAELSPAWSTGAPSLRAGLNWIFLAASIAASSSPCPNPCATPDHTHRRRALRRRRRARRPFEAQARAPLRCRRASASRGSRPRLSRARCPLGRSRSRAARRRRLLAEPAFLTSAVGSARASRLGGGRVERGVLDHAPRARRGRRGGCAEASNRWLTTTVERDDRDASDRGPRRAASRRPVRTRRAGTQRARPWRRGPASISGTTGLRTRLRRCRRPDAAARRELPGAASPSGAASWAAPGVLIGSGIVRQAAP